MFVSFLMPFVDRGQGPIFQGLMLKQVAAFERGHLTLIADAPYFENVSAPWGLEMDLCGLRFSCPEKADFEATPRAVLPAAIFEELKKRCTSMLDAYRILLTEDYPPLREALSKILRELHQQEPVDAVLTWCNAPSLSRAAAELQLPVIHNELGPLRTPKYQGTIYFDFKGVNGQTSAEGDMHRFAWEGKRRTAFQPLFRLALRELFCLTPEEPATPPVYHAGAALQVEDDSNLLAYGRGWTNFELVFAARKGVTAREVLVRKHPRGYADYSPQLGVPDTSSDAGAFLKQCESVFSINSSVAFECLLEGKPVTVLGDSPAAGLSRERFEKMTPETQALCLNYLFVAYLVPVSLLYDREYYLWRLTRPGFWEIYGLHLALFAQARKKPLSVRKSPPLPAPVVLAENKVQESGKDLEQLPMNPSPPSAGKRVPAGRVRAEMERAITPAHSGPLPQEGEGVDARKKVRGKTILFVSHDASRTGAPIYLLNLIRWFGQKTDWDFKILLRQGGPLEQEFRELGETIVAGSTTDTRSLLEGVTLIYSNTCTNGQYLRALQVGDIPIITHVHELDYVIELFGKVSFDATVEQTTQFIACSRAVADCLQDRKGIAAERVKVIYESIPLETLWGKAGAIAREQLRAYHRVEPDAFVVVACGGVDWRKGPDLFLQVADLTRRGLGLRRPVKFIWVGLVPEDDRRRILTRDLELLELQDVVEFVGAQENPYPYLNLADAFCLPSREDPFPLVMLEAAALGKPVICFDKAGGAPEFCQRGGGFSVGYLSVESMAACLVQLAQDDELRRRAGGAAERLVREEFDLDVTAPEILRLVDETAGPTATEVAARSAEIRAYCEEANSCVVRGEFAQADALLAQALKVNPADPGLLLARGNTLFQLRDLAGARDQFANAVAQTPTDAAAHAGLGMVLVQMGRVTEGEVALRAALSLAPGHVMSLRLVAALCLRDCRYAEGAARCADLLRVIPGDAEVLICQARCRHAMGHVVLAELLLEQVLDTDPGHSQARELLLAWRGESAAPVSGELDAAWIAS